MAAGILLLAGCSAVPEEVDPTVWYGNVLDTLTGRDTTPTDSTSRDTAKAAAKDQAFPTLGAIPQRPQVASPSEYEAEKRHLADQRQQALTSAEGIRLLPTDGTAPPPPSNRPSTPPVLPADAPPPPRLKPSPKVETPPSSSAQQGPAPLPVEDRISPPPGPPQLAITPEVITTPAHPPAPSPPPSPVAELPGTTPTANDTKSPRPEDDATRAALAQLPTPNPQPQTTESVSVDTEIAPPPVAETAPPVPDPPPLAESPVPPPPPVTAPTPPKLADLPTPPLPAPAPQEIPSPPLAAAQDSPPPDAETPESTPQLAFATITLRTVDLGLARPLAAFARDEYPHSQRVLVVHHPRGQSALSADDQTALAKVVAEQEQRGGVIRVVAHAEGLNDPQVTPERRGLGERLAAARGDRVVRALARQGAKAAVLYAGTAAVATTGDTVTTADLEQNRTEIFIDYRDPQR